MRPTCFPNGKQVTPYLRDWHLAFSQHSPSATAVEVWFDRGTHPSIVECIFIPKYPDIKTSKLISTYLATVINNILCSYGAKSFQFFHQKLDYTESILDHAQHILFFHASRAAEMPQSILYMLNDRLFALPGDSLKTTAAARGAIPDRQGVVSGKALAINIGEHLTTWGVSTLNPDGSHAVLDVHRLNSRDLKKAACFTEGFQTLVHDIRQQLATGADEVEAIGIAVATTVVSGHILAADLSELFDGCSQEVLENMTEQLRQICRRHFPGCPVTIANDALAQAKFVFHHAGGRERIATSGNGTHMLSVRLGACPCVGCLDVFGNAPFGLHEYAWMATRLVGSPSAELRCSTIRYYLSHYGVAAVAHELGLLERHALDPREAIPFFHERLLSGDAQAQREAARIYGILGAHLAMFAHEIDRHRRLACIHLLGSRSNRLDQAAFFAIQEGFKGFAASRNLPVAGSDLVLIADASVQAGLVGAAHLALDAARSATR